MSIHEESFELERYELYESPRYRFRVTRRAFVQTLGTGMLIAWGGGVSFAQRNSRDEEEGPPRFHIGKDGVITALTGKVEVGQGSRTQISQAVAEEFRVPVERVQLLMSDTGLVPNDGGTYGSLTTPRTIPTVRRAAASARELLIEFACNRWGVGVSGATISDGVIMHAGGDSISYGELAATSSDFDAQVDGYVDREGALTPHEAWKVLGQGAVKANGREVATGAHRYPSDIQRPNMLYGKILRPPSYGAELIGVNLDAVKELADVTAVHDGNFVGCMAPTSYQAQDGIDALSVSAQWRETTHPSSTDLARVLKENTQSGSGRRRSRDEVEGDVDGALVDAAQVVVAEYFIPYIQHAPMEPRAAVAEWDGEKVTVWTGTQRPFGVREELTEAFGIGEENVRVIVPDTGGGFGGKHTGDAAVEAARLAKEAGRPVAVHWTREEEFTWAYFRPAGVMTVAAAIDGDGRVTGWDFTNYNAGGSSLECPYTFENKRTRVQRCDSPLREGSYRCLAAASNNFAREVHIDRLAANLGQDPLAFRLGYLDETRFIDVLEAVAALLGWEKRGDSDGGDVGYGIACGNDKGSYVACCAEVEVGGNPRELKIRRVCVAYECGGIQNPKNLLAQVEGGIVMGLGAVLRERMEFRDGKILNGRFSDYEVPRFVDVPPFEVVLLDRPDLESVGAGETPLIGIAPAVANAVFDVTGEVVTSLPIRLA